MRTARALALLFAASCVATPVDRTERFGGPIPPCDADPRLNAPPQLRATQGLSKHGSYFAWNTHPAQWCNDNPLVPIVATRTIKAVTGDSAPIHYRNGELYITYPTATDPTVSGAAAPAPGRHPVVVFSHANNDSVCQIFESYYSLHDQWASWGWVVVSVDGTPFNCQRGTPRNLELRTQAIESAIDRLHELNADPHSRFFGALDLDLIVLAGHSRGGGASLVAATRREVAGVIALQTIDPRRFGFRGRLADVPTVGITAGNDVDLHYPRVEAIEDQLRGPYSWVNLNGGIHAYTADTVPLEFDDRPKITRNLQHWLTNLYTTAFLQHLVDGSHTDILYALDGGRAARDISASGVYQRWRTTADAVWIDTFDGTDTTRNDLGGVVVADGFQRVAEVTAYAPNDDEPDDRYRTNSSLVLTTAQQGRYATEVTAAAGATRVEFRAKGPDFGVPARLTVEVTFADGTTQRTAIDEAHRGPLPLSNRFQQVVVPLTNAAPVVELVFEVRGGTLFIDDLRLLFDDV